MKGKALHDGLFSFLFPSRCVFCGKLLPRGEAVCAGCGAALPELKGPLCKKCGREKAFCACGGRHFEFERCIAPYYYEGPAKKGIRRLKFGNKPFVGSVMARAIAAVLEREYAGIPLDLVTAVPLGRAEQRRRGYNQSAQLARPLAERLGRPYGELLLKTVTTRPQRECGAAERWGNVFGVFGAKEPARLRGKTVLLVDDIMTTGATLNECAKMLKLAGAKAVYCAVAACVRKNAGGIPPRELSKKSTNFM